MVSLHAAGLPDGVGEGFQAFPCMGWWCIMDNSGISHSMPHYLAHSTHYSMPYILPPSYLSL